MSLNTAPGMNTLPPTGDLLRSSPLPSLQGGVADETLYSLGAFGSALDYWFEVQVPVVVIRLFFFLEATYGQQDRRGRYCPVGGLHIPGISSQSQQQSMPSRRRAAGTASQTVLPPTTSSDSHCCQIPPVSITSRCCRHQRALGSSSSPLFLPGVQA
jgi:hypothetical protein